MSSPSLVPTLEIKTPEFRGNSSSADLNSMSQQTLYDLNQIFLTLTEWNTNLSEAMSVIRNEVLASNNRLVDLNNTVDARRIELGKRTFFENFTFTTNIVYPTPLSLAQRCPVNSELGIVTLPVNQTLPRVYTIMPSTGEIHQSPALRATVTPIDETGVLNINTTNPLRALNGNNQSFWERKLDFDVDSAKTEVSCKLEITLPPTNHPGINTLILQPYPEGVIDVLSFTYDTLTTQNNVVPNFSAVNNILGTVFSFDEISAINFKLKLRRRQPMVNEGFLSFVYGLRELGIFNTIYQPLGSIGIKFSLPADVTGTLKKLTKFVSNPTYTHDNPILKWKIFVKEAEFHAGVPFWTSDEPAITTANPLDISAAVSRDIWILADLSQESGRTHSVLLDNLLINYTI